MVQLMWLLIVLRLSSVSPTEVESAAGGNITFTINGDRFSVGATG